MKNDKELDLANETEMERDDIGAQRARNRTVMLSPDVTGEVRARLAQDNQAPGFNFGRSAAPASSSASAGFTRPAAATPPAASRSTREQLVNLAASQAESSAPEVPAAPAKAASQSGDYVTWSKRGPVMGFLVSYDKNPDGDVFNLYPGRLIISSEPASSGSFLVINDDSVSPMHAILRIGNSGEVQVLDQLSEFGTKIKHFGKDAIEELSGDKGTLEHGDTIVFGERKFHFCVVAKE